MMSIDQAMNEYCSDAILNSICNNEKTPGDIFENFIRSIAELIKNNETLGPKGQELAQQLNAIYAYNIPDEMTHHFDRGAAYGCVKLLECFRE